MSQILFLQESPIFENLGIYYLSACLKSRGHWADLLFLSHESNVISYIKQKKIDAIGFNAFTGGHHWVSKVAKYIKSQVDLPVIVGGPHVTEFPENMLKHSHIDFAMHGEIDYQLCDLLEELEKDVPRFGEIPNLIWREDGHIIKNEKQTITTDVDSLPFPDREIYYKYPFLRNMDLKRFLSGRGCPYFCAFCSIPAFLGKYLGRKEILRRHSVDRVIAEVLHVKERYPLRVVHFHDDIFPFNIKWLEEFSDRYRKEIDVPFICNARLDTTKQRFDLLKEAGCGGVQLGLESADEEMRNKLLAKSLTDESIIDTTAYLHKIGLPFLTTSIVNLPGETIDDAIATVDLNVRIKPKRMRLGRLTPIPNLPITDYGQEHGFIRKDFDEDEIEGANTNYMITEYDEEFLLVTQYSVLLEFFPSFSPWSSLRAICFLWRSLSTALITLSGCPLSASRSIC